MKPLPFKIIKTDNVSFVVQVDDQPWFYDSLHQHPEIQIMLIESGRGTLLVNDYIGNFGPGDVYIIGSNQPHVFRCSPEYYDSKKRLRAKALSIFINKELFGNEFIGLPEFKLLRSFLSDTDYGLKVNDPASSQVSNLLHSILNKKGISKIITLLEILEILSEHAGFVKMSNLRENSFVEGDGQRINQIYQFTLNNFDREISLKEVSEMANMTETSFCRYFKKRTRKSYLNFLYEVRIGNACKLLASSDMQITDICYKSGFNNLSFFNRKFKSITRMTPREYKRLFKNKAVS